MSSGVSKPDPSRFGLAGFVDLLPSRDPIFGEDTGSFDGFHKGMFNSLAPATPYECVIAENLIAIEWELLQHRRMRDASLRQIIHFLIRDAAVAKQEEDHQFALDRSFETHIDAGGDEKEFEAAKFDEEAALDAGEDLARRAISQDREVQRVAEDEIVSLGMNPVEIMGSAYRTFESSVTRHEDKLHELERRRREVKRDFDALQKMRPIEGEVIEG